MQHLSAPGGTKGPRVYFIRAHTREEKVLHYFPQRKLHGGDANAAPGGPRVSFLYTANISKKTSSASSSTALKELPSSFSESRTHDLFEPRVVLFTMLLLMFSSSPPRAPPLNNDHRSQNGSLAATWMDDDAIALFLFPLLPPAIMRLFLPFFLFFANCLVRLHPTWPLRRPKLSLCFTFCAAIGLFSAAIYILCAPRNCWRER